MKAYDLICLGCGPAGAKAATLAASLGKRVAVVERRSGPGGTMVGAGTLATKALRETALLCAALNHRPLPGATVTVDHSMPLGRFMARRERDNEAPLEHVNPPLEWRGIDVYHGHGRFADARTIDVDAPDGSTATLHGDSILIATGSTPDRPGFVPFDHPAIVDAESVLALDHVPASMIIVGAGVIGCEYASIFAELGVSLMLLHPRDVVLPFIDAECRDHLLRAMWDQGVTLRPSAPVVAVSADGDDAAMVRLDTGEDLRADVVLWTAGRLPRTHDLGLEHLDIARDDHGVIQVNEHQQTSIPSIYAAGDVLGSPALAATSMEQGRIAVCHLFGVEPPRGLGRVLPFAVYTIPPVAMAGCTAAQAADRGQAIVTGRALYCSNRRGCMLGDEEGIMKCVFDRDTRVMLGTTIVGAEATELIHVAQSMIAHEDTLDDIMEACSTDPSLASLYQEAAANALHRLEQEIQEDAAPSRTWNIA